LCAQLVRRIAWASSAKLLASSCHPPRLTRSAALPSALVLQTSAVARWRPSSMAKAQGGIATPGIVGVVCMACAGILQAGITYPPMCPTLAAARASHGDGNGDEQEKAADHAVDGEARLGPVARTGRHRTGAVPWHRHHVRFPSLAHPARAGQWRGIGRHPLR